MESQNIISLSVIWRDKRMELEMEESSSVGELGHKLQILTEVKADTVRLLVPQSAPKGSKLIIPFSDEHSSLRLQEISVPKGKAIRMMGVFEHEIEEISKSRSKSDSRIRGFDEEQERMKQRLLTTPQSSLKLPQGPYIFSEFRTLNLPGIELDPPPSEALRRMHRLACDPGIIAIMNKHHWRVGIMTEMAPVGYVGISPVCLLGLNKNRGEEISLRLRTDDLKGFRKYESIKKTLIHELAHMVHSDHNADFYALNKQLVEEAVKLDWTRSGSWTLNGQRIADSDDAMLSEPENFHSGPHKLGGIWLGGSTSDPRSTSAAAAIRRMLTVDPSEEKKNVVSKVDDEPGRVLPGPNLDNELDQVLPEPNPVSTSDRVLSKPDPEVDSDRVLPQSNLGNGPNRVLPKSELDASSTHMVMDLERELDAIEEPAVAMCRRLEKAIETLRHETSSLKTLLKIIRNLVDHPGEAKYRHFRKANPMIQRHVTFYPDAMEVLAVIGFREEVVGNEPSLVLKRNDPGLLWLAKSFVEAGISGSNENTPSL